MQLRQEVFVIEQDCPYLDADGLDPQAMHLLGWSQEGELVAYLRVFSPGLVKEDWVIGRVVVSPRRRREGLGKAIMLEAHRQLKGREGSIFLSGQSYLQKFYEDLGYQVCGEGYLEDGIPHLPMRRE